MVQPGRAGGVTADEHQLVQDDLFDSFALDIITVNYVITMNKMISSTVKGSGSIHLCRRSTGMPWCQGVPPALPRAVA